jgi:Ca-activated chloride channel family protein
MKKLILFSVLLLFVLNNVLKAQTPFGEIRGNVTDAKNKKKIEFVAITAYLNSIAKATVYSDSDGNYAIKSLAAGTYSIKAYMTGYAISTITDIEVYSDAISFINIAMERYVPQKEIIIKDKPVLIRKDGVSAAQYNYLKMMAIPQRNINSVSSLSPGVDSRSGSTPNIRGGRSENTAYYIDGIRVQGNENSNESYNHVEQNNFKSVNHEPLSTFSIDVDRASYSNIRRYLTEGYLPPADAVRIEEMINYFDYDYEKKSSDMPFMVYTDLVDCPWKEKNKIVQITLQAPKIQMEKSAPSNLVFLIDVSGSMQSPDKLPLVQAGLKLLVRQMREEDKIAMVVYAGSVGLVLDATSGKDKDKIITAIDNLMTGGSTAGGAGIEMAYKVAKNNFIKNGNNRVILATDGDFNVGVTDNGELEKLISEKKKLVYFLLFWVLEQATYKTIEWKCLLIKAMVTMPILTILMRPTKYS